MIDFKSRVLKLIFSSILFMVFFTAFSVAQGRQILQTKDVTVQYDASLEAAAKQVLTLYPEVKKDLESLFGWKLALKPSVLLKKNRADFLTIAGDPLVVAFAVPDRKLMVIDYSKMITRPFNLEATLKHELCHILLHHHIQTENLPRWLDEGLCQWASGGIDEIIMDPKRSRLNRASFAQNFIPFQKLKAGFPHDENARLLAYEQSKSFVTYISRTFGNDALFSILNKIKASQNLEEAMQSALFISPEALEKEWHRSLTRPVTWFAYLSYYLYEILFVLMALITLVAFIKLSLKKRYSLADEEDP